MTIDRFLKFREHIALQNSIQTVWINQKKWNQYNWLKKLSLGDISEKAMWFFQSKGTYMSGP